MPTVQDAVARGAGLDWPLMRNNITRDDLDAFLDRLKAAGVEVLPDRQNYDFGKFAWVVDPDGNRVELWEPV